MTRDLDVSLDCACSAEKVYCRCRIYLVDTYRSEVDNTGLSIDDFRGACAVNGNVQVAGRTSSVSTPEMLSTHDVTLRNVDGSLFHVQI